MKHEDTPPPAASVASEFPDFFNFSTVFEDNYIQLEQFGLLFKSIDWGEPWIIGLIFFHILMTMMTCLSRRRATVQGILFFFMLTLIFVSEKLNRMAAENWKLFSRHQYFDSNGMFISTVFSIPLLFNCMIMVANWLLISSELMTTIRNLQLQQRSRKRNAGVNLSVDAPVVLPSIQTKKELKQD